MLKKIKTEKIRGIALYEMIISMLILLIFSYNIFISYSKFKENMQILEANIKLIKTFSKYRDLSYYGRESYKIDIELNKKEINFKQGTIVLETLYLPQKLRYKIARDDIKSDLISTNMNYNGNLSHAFSIYIFGTSDIAKYRIAFYTFSQLKYLIINIYKNIDAKDADYKKIYEYNISNNGKNHIGWKKE